MRKKLIVAIKSVFVELLVDGIEKGESGAESFIVLLALCFAVPVALTVVFLGIVYGFLRKLVHPKEVLKKAMSE
jgi:hypothetical protein